jgi:hypothetical protein
MKPLFLGLPGALLLLVVPLIGHAQEIVVIDFQIDWQNVVQVHGEEAIRSVESEVERDLATKLGSKDFHPHWTFAPNLTGQEAQLLFILEERESTIDLRLRAGKLPAQQEWSARWKEPGDLQAHGFPRPDRMSVEIVQAFEDKILEPRGVELGKWLSSNVPVARMGRWDSSTDLKVVFPIRYDRNERLRSATLDVVGAPQTGRKQTLRVEGTGAAASYPPDAANPDYQGVQGLAVERRFGSNQSFEPINAASMAQEMRALKLGEVYIFDEGRPGGFDLAADPADESPGGAHP